jgi:hypothetical protein
MSEYDIDKNLVNNCEIFKHNVKLHKKKICILIIYSFSKEYLEMKNILLDYYKNFKNEIKFYFVESDENAINDVELNDNIITVKKEETRLNITYKTMEAIKLVNSKYNDLEFIIRTNISTIIDIYNLQVFLNSIPNTNIYCGGQVYRIDRIDIPSGVIDKSLFGNIFVQGTSIIFSKDIIDSLCKNIDNINYKIVDDVTFGLFIKDNHTNIIQSRIPYKYNAKILVLHDKINEKDIDNNSVVFYRNKSINRNTDVLNLKTISYFLSNKYKK